MSGFSRREWLQGLAGVAAGAAFARVGLWPSVARAQTAEKASLFLVFLKGGYNAVFGSADSFAGAGTFGVSGSNQLDLGNGLVVDKPTFGTMPAYALSHMATVGVKHGISQHGPAEQADVSDGRRSYLLQLAAAMGGEGSIKAAQVGSRSLPGPTPPEAGVSLQVITDMASTIATLGGTADPNAPKREFSAPAMRASQFLSSQTLVKSPVMTKELGEGYAAAVETLEAPVKPFDFNELATAYGIGATATSVNNFTRQVAAAELMITAGTNVVVAMDNGWDTHGDRTASTVRNRMNSRILPPLNTFLSRMVGAPDRNVVVAIIGDFARSLPGSDHARVMSATVIGKYVKTGTTGRVTSNVGLPDGTPSVPGLWAYLSKVLNSPTSPFGANPHTGLVATS